jgi:hypothetical protein
MRWPNSTWVSGFDPVRRLMYVKSTYCAHTGHEDRIEQDGVNTKATAFRLLSAEATYTEAVKHCFPFSASWSQLKLES